MFLHYVRRDIQENLPMANTVPMIGIDPGELAWIRMLVLLLRHPDPVVPELTRQALCYLEAAASRSGIARPDREAAPAMRRQQ
jgi:hypothetical protein